MRVPLLTVVSSSLLCLAIPGCNKEPARACAPGQSVACPCPGGGNGVQVCAADGMRFGACEQCVAPQATAPVATVPPAQLHVTATSYELSQTGGAGGGPFTFRCPEDNVVTGIYGRAGSRVDSLSIFCSPISSPASSTRHEAVAGGGGSGPFESKCPSGQVVVGLYGHGGSEVDMIGPVCAAPKEWAAGGGEVVRVASSGGAGGGPFEIMCPSAHVLTAIQGRSGERLDRVGGICKKLE